MLCGLPDVETIHVSIVGLEPEENWRLMLEIARDEFRKRTGIEFDAVMTNDPRNLFPNGQTIGSFVLSDAARAGTLTGLLHGIRDNTSHDKAWFLDFPSYTCPKNGKTYVNKSIQDRGFVCNRQFLPEMNLGVKEAIAAEIKACDPIYCRRDVNEEPKVNFITVKLR